MNPGIFREYDIRGVAGVDIMEEDVRDIGRAYGSLLRRQNRKKVSVGRDCRQTSDAYSELFI
ncbi:MAG: phosphomannomutase, partial [Desulfovibrionales bacterium]|nr:phosphomannomutase [Desulfovibrionales bacterium]